MPPLSSTIRKSSPNGFAAADTKSDTPAVVIPDLGRALGGNPYLRSTLPPFNASSDTLRQFNESGKTPARRVIPLPVGTSTGGGGSITNNNTIINQGSSGGSSSTKLTPAVVTIQTPAIVPGGSYQTSVTMAKAFQLQQATASNPVEIRVYADAGTQGFDATRATDTAAPFEVTQGLISDVVFDTSPYVWTWQNRVASSPVGNTTFYVTVINPTGGSMAGVTITLAYLPME